jgi:transcriptional regulator with XRE-family HTH domain
MEKSIFTEDYLIFLRTLRDVRVRTGLTQAQLAERLGQTQSWVSRCERGERRLDIVELRAFCRAMEISFAAFVTRFDREAERREQRR